MERLKTRPPSRGRCRWECLPVSLCPGNHTVSSGQAIVPQEGTAPLRVSQACPPGEVHCSSRDARVFPGSFPFLLRICSIPPPIVFAENRGNLRVIVDGPACRLLQKILPVAKGFQLTLPRALLVCLSASSGRSKPRERSFSGDSRIGLIANEERVWYGE